MTPTFIWLDGKLVPWRDSRVHVLTRICDGGVFRLAAHSQRLISRAVGAGEPAMR